MGNNIKRNHIHSSAWIVQSWASFVLSIAAMSVGIVNLPVDNWVKGYMGMGLMFTVGSTLSIAKTTRDLHEERQFLSKVDEARLEKLLAEHNVMQ